MYYVISSKNYVEHLEAKKSTEKEAMSFVECIKGSLFLSDAVIIIKDENKIICEIKKEE